MYSALVGSNNSTWQGSKCAVMGALYAIIPLCALLSNMVSLQCYSRQLTTVYNSVYIQCI